jgi:guanylate kinase
MDGVPRSGLLVVLSAPSGGGKTTLTNELLVRLPKAKKSLSCTTRPQRTTEIPDQDYQFISDADFDKHVQANAFAEWAQVHGFRYGTLKKNIEDAVATGHVLFLVIDVQGAGIIKKSFPDCISIFVMPPDFDVLESRLRKRGTETESEIRRRLENARKEIALAPTFDYQVLNDRLDRVVLEIESIIRKKTEKRT